MLPKELLTVTAEKETKHSDANRKKNIPPSVGFSEYTECDYVYHHLLCERTALYSGGVVYRH
jgi:hypothetical protein